MLQLVRRFFQLYFKSLHKRFACIILLAIVAGIFETFGLILIYPVLRILIEPEIVLNNIHLHRIYKFLQLSEPKFLAAIFAGLAVLLFIIKNLYMVLFMRLQLNLIRDCKVKIRTQLINYYMQMPYISFLQKKSSALIGIIQNSTVLAIHNVIFSFMNLIVNMIISGIIVFTLTIQYFLYLFFLTIFISSSVYVLYKLMRRKLHVLSEKNRNGIIEEYKVLQQSLVSIKETKVNNAEPFFIKSFIKANRDLAIIESKMLLYQRIPSFILEIIIIIFIVIMSLAVVLSQENSGVGIVSSLGVLAAASFRLAPLASRIIAALNAMSSSKADLEILIKEAEMPDFFRTQQLAPPLVDQLPKQLPLCRELKLDNISFCYPNSQNQALKNVHLTIKSGELIGIVGASGAGKSTFADILLGLLEPQTGQVCIDSTLLAPENMCNWRVNIGYVPQAIVLIDTTIRESVAFGIAPEEIDDQQVEQALKKASFWDFVQTLPQGIYAPVGENGKNLSGGQRQRIAIARALYRNVQVLILDEATSALDNATEFEIASAIESLRGKCTILVIAHRLSTLKRSDRILFFRDGELVDSGSFAELSKHEDFKQMLEVSKIEI